MRKTVLITGAAGNMGRAMVKKFLSEDYHVVGTLVPGHPRDIQTTGDEFETEELDLTDEKASAALVNSLAARGNIDIAILTVGGFTMAGIADTSINDINKQLQLNFSTAYNVARPVFLQMKKQGHGRIFLVGSGPGMNMHKSMGMVAYGLSKSLVFRLAELMNEEAKDTDVVTQVIVPSTIDTPENRKAMPNADTSKWVKPETIADEVFKAINDIKQDRLLLF